MSILRIAGIPPELYKGNDYASDVIVFKLYSSNIIEKLLELVENGGEDHLNVAFVAMPLYFLRMFLCAFDTDGISSKARITMFWSSLMWYSSMNGIHEMSHYNCNTVCIGCVFLSM